MLVEVGVCVNVFVSAAISLRLQGKLSFPYNCQKWMVKYMYYYVNILLTKNALNTFISNENNFVQNQLLRSADSISFSFIPVAYSALLCWSPASIDFNGAALNRFFSARNKTVIG